MVTCVIVFSMVTLKDYHLQRQQADSRKKKKKSAVTIEKIVAAQQSRDYRNGVLRFHHFYRWTGQRADHRKRKNILESL